jgi:hypothetical protein
MVIFRLDPVKEITLRRNTDEDPTKEKMIAD